MYNLSVQTANGEVLQLTGKEAVYQILSVAGLNPPAAQINTTSIVGMDGAAFNSSKLQTRNIVIMCRINGDVEENRLALYRYFRTKDPCRVYYSNDTVDVYIDGYVDSLECDYFTQGETAQISIICPYPYFRSVQQMTVSSNTAIGLFTFPFSINIGHPIPISSYDGAESVNAHNPAESEAGVNIEVHLSAPCTMVEIKNTTTGESMRLRYAFETGDAILINTTKGAKSVALIRNAVRSNLFAALQPGSVFPQLAIGNNAFVTLMDGYVNSAAYTVYRYSYNYRGV